VYSTTYVSRLSGNANMALSLIQGTGVDLGIRSNPNSLILFLFYFITKLALKSDLREEISTRDSVEAELFKKLGLFEVRSVPKRSNKFASLDDMVRDA
jgi:adenylate cyclase class IV